MIIADQAVMVIDRAGQGQQVLQQNMNAGGVEQIGPAGDMGDPLAASSTTTDR